MRLRLLPIITVFFGLFGSAQPLFADPITARFYVTVIARADVHLDTGYESIDPFSFVLSATFDDQVTDYRNANFDSHARFGPVTFSGVPELGGPTPGDVQYGESSLYRENCCDAVRATLTAGLGGDLDSSTDSFGRDKWIRLMNDGTISSMFLPPEEATAARLLSILSSGTIDLVNTATTRSATGELLFVPESYSYIGRFTQLDSAPVPEPASVLLVATGLLGAGVRRWRQRNTSDPTL